MVDPITIINNTGTVNVGNDFVSMFIPALITAVVGGTITLSSVFYQRREHRRSGLMEVFKIINDDNHKKVEKVLTDSKDNLKTFEDIKKIDDVKRVCRNYAGVGILLKNNLVPSDEFYLHYGVITVRMHTILRPYLDERRKTFKEQYAYFTILAKNCFDYWERKCGITVSGTNRKIQRSELGAIPILD